MTQFFHRKTPAWVRIAPLDLYRFQKERDAAGNSHGFSDSGTLPGQSDYPWLTPIIKNVIANDCFAA
ncbi:hypothetical protein [Hymenobacter coccineus]|uniref:hypothetical protein n=1 Tax=Hymenobacter coccineus TaxID=1908235 RepID=UPI000F7936CA|nr:hypothetical protein [Hymenobacter coccineus]